MPAVSQPWSQTAVRKWLIEQIAGYLEQPADQIDPQAALVDFGLDSASAMQLCGDIETHLGVPADATLLWDHPTIASLSTALTGLLAENRR